MAEGGTIRLTVVDHYIRVRCDSAAQWSLDATIGKPASELHVD
jgi:hypothetical protein